MFFHKYCCLMTSVYHARCSACFFSCVWWPLNEQA